MGEILICMGAILIYMGAILIVDFSSYNCHIGRKPDDNILGRKYRRKKSAPANLIRILIQENWPEQNIDKTPQK